MTRELPRFLRVGEEIPKEVIIIGIVCLTILETCALFKGINGVLFTTVVAIIALAIGVTIPTPKLK